MAKDNVKLVKWEISEDNELQALFEVKATISDGNKNSRTFSEEIAYNLQYTGAAQEVLLKAASGWVIEVARIREHGRDRVRSLNGQTINVSDIGDLTKKDAAPPETIILRKAASITDKSKLAELIAKLEAQLAME